MRMTFGPAFLGLLVAEIVPLGRSKIQKGLDECCRGSMHEVNDDILHAS